MKEELEDPCVNCHSLGSEYCAQVCERDIEYRDLKYEIKKHNKKSI